MPRTIGKLAKQAGVNIETIRFYERKGLIEQPAKPLSGYRHYPDETLRRIYFIKHSQALGFTLSEIGSLLQLNDMPCGQVQELAENKLLSVQQKIADLQSLQQALNKLLRQCENNKDKSCCPIIDSLQPGS